MRVRLLGPLELYVLDRLPLSRAKVRATLAVLALRIGNPVSVDEFAQALWGDQVPPTARKALQGHVAFLRRLLPEGSIETFGDAYRLVGGPDCVDAILFESLIVEGRRHVEQADPGEARSAFQRALELWGGSPIPDLVDHPYGQREARRLTELRYQAEEELAEVLLAAGDHELALPELERSVLESPLRERRWIQLMTALYRAGRSAEALRSFQDCQERLAEVGLDASRTLMSLEARILDDDPSLAWTPLWGEVSATRTVRQTPPSLSRAPDVAAVLLVHHRAITEPRSGAAKGETAPIPKWRRLVDRVVQTTGGSLGEVRDDTAQVRYLGGATEALHAAVMLQQTAERITTSSASALPLVVAVGASTEPVDQITQLGALGAAGDIVCTGAVHESGAPFAFEPLDSSDAGQSTRAGAGGCYRVPWSRWTPSAPIPARLARPPSSAFVGRSEERARLDSLWQDVCDGTKRLGVLVGEPGIGKSRLATEFARAALAEGAVVLAGGCDEEPLTPYQPFVEALGPLTSPGSPDELVVGLSRYGSDLARLIPTLADIGAELTKAGPETERYQMFTAVEWLLSLFVGERPVVLILEDIHWADQPTQLLARHLVNAESGSPLLLLCTFRPTDEGSAQVERLLAELARTRPYERIELQGLDLGGVRALLGPDRAELAERVHEATDGNPLFVEELRDHLLREVEKAGPPAAAEIQLPNGVRQVIRQRVGHLPETARQAMNVAAVMGREFDLGPLVAVTGLGEDDAVDSVEAAMHAGLIEEVPGRFDRFAFTHAVIRDSLISDLSRTRRVRLHHGIALALEVAGRDTGPDKLGELAFHFAESVALGDREKAVTYNRLAGERALDSLAFEEAKAHFERALALLPSDAEQPVDVTTRCDLLLLLADAQRRSGDVQAAHKSCAEAADLARSQGSAEHLARAALGYEDARFSRQATEELDPVIALCEEAQAALDGEDSPLRAQVLSALGVLYSLQNSEEGGVVAGQALEMARRIGDPEALATALRAALFAEWYPGRAEERLVLCDELASTAASIRDLEITGEALAWRFFALLELGRPDEVEATYEEFASLSSRLRQPLYRSFLVLWDAMRATSSGRFAEAEDLVNLALQIGSDANNDLAMTYYGIQLYALRSLEGRLDELETLWTLVLDSYPENPGPRCAYAYMLAEVGRLDRAREEIARIDQYKIMEREYSSLWLVSLDQLGRACAMAADIDRCREIYAQLLPYAQFHIVVIAAIVYRGAVHGVLGVLATAIEDYPSAERHLEAALEANSAMQADALVAQNQFDLAMMLVRRARGGDKVRARELLNAARATAERLGMGSLTRKIAAGVG